MASYVIQAAVYVDDVDSPEEARRAVENHNDKQEYEDPPTVFVRLPDEPEWARTA